MTMSRRSRISKVFQGVANIIDAASKDQVIEQLQTTPTPTHSREVSMGGAVGGVFEEMSRNPDDLVTSKGGLEIYDEMRRDDGIGAFMQLRKLARLASGWEILPAEDTNEAKQHAAFVQHALERGMEPTLRAFILGMMSAYDYGFALAEKVWQRVPDGEWKGKWGFAKLAPKKPHAFNFAVDPLGNLKPNGILNLRGFEYVPMAVEDFVHYAYSAEWNNPYGSSDLRRTYTWYIIKKHLIRYEAVYYEKLAGGFTDVTYDPNKVDETELDSMEDALETLSIQTNIMHSDGFVLKVFESSGRGAIAYDKAIQTMNSYMARTILIPDLIGISNKPTGGSYAMAAKHHDTFLWVLDAMAYDLCIQVFERQIIEPLMRLNFGPQYKLPKFVFKPLSKEDKINVLTSFYAATEKGIVNPTEEDAKWVRSILEAPPDDGDPKEKVPQVPGFDPDEEIPPGEEPEEEPVDEPAIRDISYEAIEYHTMSRKLKSFEMMTDFALIEKTLDAFDESLIAGWRDLAIQQRDNLIKTVRSRKLVERQDYSSVDDIQLRKVGDVQRLLRDHLTTGFANAKYQADKELRDKQQNFRFELERYAEELVLDPVPPTEAVNIFKKKGLRISPADLKPYDRMAFQIAGAECSKLLAQSKSIITRGIKKGDRLWIEAQLKKLFDGFVQSGVQKGGSISSAWRIENIARTNMSEAYNYGRLSAYHDPAFVDEVEGYWYSAVLDDATTDYCFQMDANSPYTKEEFENVGPPPAHYQCRSTFGALLRGETWEPNSLPTGVVRQEGFVHVHVGGCSHAVA